MAVKDKENLASAYVLSFLADHDREEAEKFFEKEDLDLLAPDLPAIINLDAASKSLRVSVTLPGGATNNSVWTFELPGTIFQNLTNVQGTLYTRIDARQLLGENEFWIQQYPSGVPGQIGRTVIEFYNTKIITAIFKSSNDNFGASGSGVWTGLGPRT
ncbi:hypothetical protein JR316_0006685 [Psilocybe cubensis]|uniref:Uncharacterized protein n=2 Tax=Psilocybe cubensis TaxID=181762 RepID=A0A8H7XP82_PSICU|nr:hypothetical protein JR316_0006685 [Psilocybe cubensis]KAH9480088.1 hypothetical protein JR316_0006685 [Psilocybe cubensis]